MPPIWVKAKRKAMASTPPSTPPEAMDLPEVQSWPNSSSDQG